MENAAKALVIAGGILLAIMILSLLVYMLGTTSRMAQAQDEKKVAEQLVAFNNEYEAYNKSRLYGIEVITVVNKAIDYNGGLEPKDADKAINIELTITEPEGFKTSKQEVITNGDGEEISSTTKDVEDASIENGTYTLLGDSGTKMDQDLINFFWQDVQDPLPEKEYKAGKTVITYTYSALTNFKRAIFKCDKVDYNPENGRIEKMYFTQIR